MQLIAIPLSFRVFLALIGTIPILFGVVIVHMSDRLLK